MDGIREKGMCSTPGMTIQCHIPVPTVVDNGILGFLILKDQQVDLYMASLFPGRTLAMVCTPQASQPLRH